jgi:DEAD/DEAH box helicase domain-containing protein
MLMKKKIKQEARMNAFAEISELVDTIDEVLNTMTDFTGPLSNFRVIAKRGAPIEVYPMGSAFSNRFWMVQCTECGAWTKFEEKPEAGQQECEACGRMITRETAAECLVPNGFRTDFYPRIMDEEVIQTRRHRSLTAEGLPLDMKFDPSSNLSFVCMPQTRTYRINRGGRSEANPSDWCGFNAIGGIERLTKRKQCFLHGQYISTEHSNPRDFQQDPNIEAIDKVWLAAPKTTDSLFIAPKMVPQGLKPYLWGTEIQRDAAIRAAAISATFILVHRAARDLDIDPDEFDVVEPRMGKPDGGRAVPILQITDHLINGAGFCDRLAQIGSDGVPMFSRMIKSILEDRDKYPLMDFFGIASGHDHRNNCDQACYLCLQRYGNQMYHGLLDWRLGLAFLEMLYNSNFTCGLLDDKFEHPAIVDWPMLARGYAEDMMRFENGKGELREIGNLVAFRLGDEPHWAIVVHPLWDVDSLKGLIGDAWRTLNGPNVKIVFSNTFELARRQIRERQRLLSKETWRDA